MNDPFPTTEWTQFFALRDGEDPEGRRLALEHLYRRYWAPLYSYLRRRGFDQERTSDLLQGFFAYLLERDVVARLDLSGKLRAFLIATCKNYVSSELDKERTQKRSPQQPLLSLDLEAAERNYRRIPSTELTPDEVYEQRWAQELMHRARQRLERSETEAGRADLFQLISAAVYEESPRPNYREIAAATDNSESAVRVRVHRLRKRLVRFLREEAKLTLTKQDSVDDELGHLASLIEPS